MPHLVVYLFRFKFVMLSFHFTQEQVEEMKKKEERMEKQMNEIMAENKRLTEPLQKAREEVEELRKQVTTINGCQMFQSPKIGFPPRE